MKKSLPEVEKIKHLCKWAQKLDSNELDWGMERIEYFVKELFKYSKFKFGDIVSLNNTPEITATKSWGWLGYKNILVKGAIGKVIEVDHYKGIFRYMIEIKEHLFTFNESDLNKGYLNEKSQHSISR